MKPAIERLEHWLARMAENSGHVSMGTYESEFEPHLAQARLALADVKAELQSRTERAYELHRQSDSWRELVTLCEHGSVCELGFWQAGNRRWFAQVKLMSGDELDVRSGETPEEAVANAVALMAERDSNVEG